MNEGMSANSETRQLAETGYYEILHDYINKMYEEIDGLMKGKNTSGRISSLILIYNGFIVPTCEELRSVNPEDFKARKFDEAWGNIDKKYYGQNFHLTGMYKSIEEATERFAAVSEFLNSIGVTKIKEREENWEDAEIDFYEEELK